MAIQDINNPLASGELAKGTGTYKLKNTADTGKSASKDKVQNSQTVNQTGQDQNAAGTVDTYEKNDSVKFVSELTNMVDTEEPEPREEVIDNVRERISSGYYNSEEFLTNLASKLINTGII